MNKLKKISEYQTPSDPSRPEQFKDELNFAEFPLASLADHVPAEQKTLSFVDTIFDQGANQYVTRKLTITASEQFGLPRALDEEIILGLIQLSNRQGFENKRVYFSSYELIKLLGWSDSAKSYRRIEEALNRWMTITLFYDKAWWSREDKCWVNEKFHILESVTIFDKERRVASKKLRPDDEHAGRSYFVWNDKVFRSFQTGNLKEIDLDVYLSLKSAISKRIYRFLDKRFHPRRHLEFDLKIFAYEHIGISRSSSLSEVKRLLTKPILELEEIGFIKPVDRAERYRKLCKGEYKIIFTRGEDEAKALLSEAQQQALMELKSRGVTAGKASKLVRASSPDKVAEKIAIHDWMLSTGDKRCSENPPGFLVNAIQHDYPIPAGFLRSKEQGRSELRVVEKRQPQLPQVVEITESDRQAENERQLFESWWNTLSSEEKTVTEEKALLNADPFSHKQYVAGKLNPGTLFNVVRKNILLEEFRRQPR